MNHFSLEFLGKERQQNMLEEQVREQRVHGVRPRVRLSLRRICTICAAIVLTYFWLFG